MTYGEITDTLNYCNAALFALDDIIFTSMSRSRWLEARNAVCAIRDNAQKALDIYEHELQPYESTHSSGRGDL